MAQMKKSEVLATVQSLRGFISESQLGVICLGLRGEEASFFLEKSVEYGARINTMPKTYEQDGKGQDAIAYLHYFKNGCDWYITEKDMEPEQYQAFGMARLNGWEPELGYISIIELMEAEVELDLHFTPTKLSEIKGLND
jgi:hypothetical protein